MRNKYEFTLERRRGVVRIIEYHQRGIFVSNTPLGDEAQDIVEKCRNLHDDLNLGRTKFNIEVGD